MVSSISRQSSCVVFLLFKPVSPFYALNSWEIAARIVVSRLWWDNRRHCGITSRSYITLSRGTLYPPQQSMSSTRDLVKPGTDCWDRWPLNHCLLTTQSLHNNPPLHQYLCAPILFDPNVTYWTLYTFYIWQLSPAHLDTFYLWQLSPAQHYLWQLSPAQHYLWQLSPAQHYSLLTVYPGCQ